MSRYSIETEVLGYPEFDELTPLATNLYLHLCFDMDGEGFFDLKNALKDKKYSVAEYIDLQAAGLIKKHTARVIRITHWEKHRGGE